MDAATKLQEGNIPFKNLEACHQKKKMDYRKKFTRSKTKKKARGSNLTLGGGSKLSAGLNSETKKKKKQEGFENDQVLKRGLPNDDFEGDNKWKPGEKP